MIYLSALTNRELVTLLHAAEAELHRRVAEADTLAARVNDWFESLERTNTVLGCYISQRERKAIRNATAEGRNRG